MIVLRRKDKALEEIEEDKDYDLSDKNFWGIKDKPQWFWMVCAL